jgi:hypothetical protein
MNRYELERTLADNGHEPIVLAGRIVILPHAGRVIGLFPTDEENALWVDGAALGEAAPAGWPNYGGLAWRRYSRAMRERAGSVSPRGGDGRP